MILAATGATPRHPKVLLPLISGYPLLWVGEMLSEAGGDHAAVRRLSGGRAANDYAERHPQILEMPSQMKELHRKHLRTSADN